MTHTKDILAGALREAGLNDMANQAATGYYHDFLSPLDLPETQLLTDLTKAARVAKSFNNLDQLQKILALRKRHINGEFDASSEESEAWAKSPEGQAAFKRLVDDK